MHKYRCIFYVLFFNSKKNWIPILGKKGIFGMFFETTLESLYLYKNRCADSLYVPNINIKISQLSMDLYRKSTTVFHIERFFFKCCSI